MFGCIQKRLSTFLVAGLILLPAFLRADLFSPIVLKPLQYDLKIQIDFKQQRLNGNCLLTVQNVGEEAQREIPLELYRLMKVSAVTDRAGNPLVFQQRVQSYEDWEQLQVNYITAQLPEALPPGDSTSILIRYDGLLLGYTETGMRYVQDRIDPEFTIIRPDCRAYPMIGVPSWKTNRAAGLPEFDYRVQITVPETLVVANGGRLTVKSQNTDRVTWQFENIKPAWRIDLAIADYGVLNTGKNRIYYFREDSLAAQNIAGSMNKTLNLYKEWFGPLNNYQGFSMIEIPDGWGSQTDKTAIIQAAAAFKDPHRMYELYHEISHLWQAPETEKYPVRWNEGLSMFLQYLTVEKLEHHPAQRQAVEKVITKLHKQFTQKPRLANIPFIEYGKQSLTGLSYSYGMLVFYKLYLEAGEAALLKTVGEYYQSHADQGASLNQFLRELNSNSKVDLTPVYTNWIFSSNVAEAIASGSVYDELFPRTIN